ncbi:hypothetical protein P171DRAFT_440752 [Karstenula rhodostoma CBS 690.94]|uniref:Uncharacterized protein n=1 Tax=Karstenula rhodostoma CBS 690.94 TaxID=1392251 RepID=A0A9P4PSY3_9PLEO|nr:hypothetical protein P171DRAFT_440752 [Karstenula rhodostoma CBS 690.94]
MTHKQDDIKDQYVDLAIEYLPCSKSQYHKLRCNHVVKTETTVPCGTNCCERGTASEFICHDCLDSERCDSGMEGQVEYRETKPTSGEDEWVSALFAAHPEAFEVKKEKRKPHRLGQGFWQLQEIQRTIDAAKSPRGRAPRVGEQERADKRARRMTMEYPE